MKFAYHATMCNPAFYLDLAKEAEAIGFDTFSMADSIFYPQDADSKYPYNADGSREFLDGVPFIEPFVLSAWMGAVTTKLKFSTSVLKLPIRNPVLVAKQLSSLAVLTNNRFMAGIGLSPWKEDFEVCGAPWEGRGKRMDEMIHIIRGLMRGEYFGYEGEHFNFAPVKLCPVPTQPVPILIGGHADVALKRAATLGDGWISAGASFEELAAMIGKLKGFREAAGLADQPFDIHGITAEAYSPEGIKRLEDIGVTEVIVAFRNTYEGGPDNRTLKQMIGEMHWYADNVIAKSRG